jgi:hypothetical protein
MRLLGHRLAQPHEKSTTADLVGFFFRLSLLQKSDPVKGLRERIHAGFVAGCLSDNPAHADPFSLAFWFSFPFLSLYENPLKLEYLGQSCIGHQDRIHHAS